MSDPPAPTTLAVYQADLTPLRGRWGQAWARSLGASKDTTVERARQAVLAGAVSRAPDDALPYLGADVQIEQLPGEPDALYRTRIAGAWESWVWAGTRHGLEIVLELLVGAGLLSSFRLATARELHRDPWAQWFAFVVPNSMDTRRTWGSPGAWGVGIWGSTGSRESVRASRRLLRQQSNARDRGWIINLYSSPGVWGTPGTWGTGTWGGRNPRWRI